VASSTESINSVVFLQGWVVNVTSAVSVFMLQPPKTDQRLDLQFCAAIEPAKDRSPPLILWDAAGFEMANAVPNRFVPQV
jgi:hypothetical protein